MTAEKLTLAHLSQVAELEKVCFADPWSEKALEILVTDEAYGAVCLENGRAMAYGSILWGVDEGQIINVATHPDARRRGRGAAVLEHLIATATTRGCDQLSLEVRISNAPAIALYERYGFLKMGLRRGFYKHPTEDSYVMCLSLGNAKK